MKIGALSLCMALALLCSCQMQEFETPYEEDYSSKPEPREDIITAIYMGAAWADAMAVILPDGLTAAEVIQPMP